MPLIKGSKSLIVVQGHLASPKDASLHNTECRPLIADISPPRTCQYSARVTFDFGTSPDFTLRYLVSSYKGEKFMRQMVSEREFSLFACRHFALCVLGYVAHMKPNTL
jgi:hypothetical protein